MNKPGRRPWLVVAGGFLNMALLHSMIQTCFSLFLVPVTGELHISRGAFGVCSSLVALMTLLLSPVMGRYLASPKVRWLLPVNIVGMGLCYASYGLAQHTWHLYLSAIGVGIFSCGAVMLPISIIITGWFAAGRGKALSIAAAGSGLGGSLITPFLNSMLASWGWRTAFFFFGGLMIAVALPVALILLRPAPAVTGIADPGQPEDKSEKAPETKILGALWREKGFYSYLLGMFSLCVVAYGSLTQMSACLTDLYGADFSARIVSLFLFLLTFGKITLGWIYDRWGITVGNVYVLGFFTLTMVLLVVPGTEMLMYAMAVCFAIGNCSGTITPTVVTAALFGQKAYGQVFGIVNMACMAGSLVAAPLLAGLYDAFGSYQYAWLLCAGLCVLALVCLQYANRRLRRFAPQA